MFRLKFWRGRFNKTRPPPRQPQSLSRSPFQAEAVRLKSWPKMCLNMITFRNFRLQDPWATLEEPSEVIVKDSVGLERPRSVQSVSASFQIWSRCRGTAAQKIFKTCLFPFFRSCHKSCFFASENHMWSLTVRERRESKSERERVRKEWERKRERDEVRCEREREVKRASALLMPNKLGWTGPCQACAQKWAARHGLATSQRTSSSRVHLTLSWSVFQENT